MQFKLNEKGIKLFKLFLSKRHSDEYIDNFNFAGFERRITLEAYMVNHIVYREPKYRLEGHCHSPMSEYTSRQLGRDPDSDYHKLVLTRNEVDIIS